MAQPAVQTGQPWRARLYLPKYRIGEAARYAELASQTVSAWHKRAAAQAILSVRESREALSYLQLIEVAVVAAFRRAGGKLDAIARARAYAKEYLNSDFPFAEYKFKTDGRDLIIDFMEVEGEHGRGKMLSASQGGQLAWEEVIGQSLREFDYEDHKGLALRWHVRGRQQSIVIDPRVAFGAPAIRGTPTWAIRDRWMAEETLPEIAEDFDLSPFEVREALIFEGINEKRISSRTVH